ncbi:hypothetical protein SLE2022_258680 [Rubroshorea leprosula]
MSSGIVGNVGNVGLGSSGNSGLRMDENSGNGGNSTSGSGGSSGNSGLGSSSNSGTRCLGIFGKVMSKRCLASTLKPCPFVDYITNKSGKIRVAGT